MAVRIDPLISSMIDQAEQTVTRVVQSRWLRLALLFLLTLRLALPLLDHHATEYDPTHTHVVLGAGNAEDRARAMEAHKHLHSRPHTHHATEGHQRGSHELEPQVVPISSPATFLHSLLLFGYVIFLGALGLLPAANWHVRRLLSHPLRSLTALAFAPPVPPPRAAL